MTPGTAFVSIGTSGVLFVSNARFSPNTEGAVHAFCHAIPDTWHQMGVILSASDSLEWLSRIAGRKPRRARRGGRSPWRPSDVTFLPYLSGERTPHNDAAARGAFVGLAQSHGLRRPDPGGDGGRRLRLRRLPARAASDAGTDFAAALAVGGGARSETWLRIIASRARPPAASSPPTATSAPPSARRGSRSAPPKAPTPAEGLHRARNPAHASSPTRRSSPRYREGYARYRSPLSRARRKPVMSDFFKGIEPVPFKGPDSDDPLAFRYYDKDQVVLGKPMRDHFRFAVAYWHTFAGRAATRSAARPSSGRGPGRQSAPSSRPGRVRVFKILGADFYCFHDRDVAPEGKSLAETNRNVRDRRHLREEDGADRHQAALGHREPVQQPPLHARRRHQPERRRVRLRRRAGEEALEVTKELGGGNYVFWGGREGYQTLLNTDMKRELDHLGRFLHMAVDYKHKIGFQGSSTSSRSRRSRPSTSTTPTPPRLRLPAAVRSGR